MNSETGMDDKVESGGNIYEYPENVLLLVVSLSVCMSCVCVCKYVWAFIFLVNVISVCVWLHIYVGVRACEIEDQIHTQT